MGTRLATDRVLAVASLRSQRLGSDRGHKAAPPPRVARSSREPEGSGSARRTHRSDDHGGRKPHDEADRPDQPDRPAVTFTGRRRIRLVVAHVDTGPALRRVPRSGRFLRARCRPRVMLAAVSHAASGSGACAARRRAAPRPSRRALSRSWRGDGDVGGRGSSLAGHGRFVRPDPPVGAPRRSQPSRRAFRGRGPARSRCTGGGGVADSSLVASVGAAVSTAWRSRRRGSRSRLSRSPGR